jgi:hypothetical protein
MAMRCGSQTDSTSMSPAAAAQCPPSPYGGSSANCMVCTMVSKFFGHFCHHFAFCGQHLATTTGSTCNQRHQLRPCSDCCFCSGCRAAGAETCTTSATPRHPPPLAVICCCQP